MICPYCRTDIGADALSQKICEGCSTPHHVECFEENGGCTLFGCKFAPPDEPKVQVGTLEVARAVGFSNQAGLAPRPTFTGFGDVQAPLLMRTAAASAPSVTGAPPPPPPLPDVTADTGIGAAAAVQTPAALESSPLRAETPGFVTPGGIFDSAPDEEGNLVASRKPKNRLVYILLGLGLGILGVHNFYAGYRKTAILQLCLTVLSLLYAAPITAVWAIAEVCTVDRDSQQVEFD